MQWYVYLLYCSDGSYYTGITTDPERRLYEHNKDDRKAARYTRARRPVNMVYFELCDSRSDAASREYQIRKSSHKNKQALADSMKSDWQSVEE